MLLLLESAAIVASCMPSGSCRLRDRQLTRAQSVADARRLRASCLIGGSFCDTRVSFATHKPVSGGRAKTVARALLTSHTASCRSATLAKRAVAIDTAGASLGATCGSLGP